MNKHIHILLLFICLYGCSGSSTPSSTIPLFTGNKQITDLVVSELQANNEWYRIVNQTELEIENPPKQYIIDFTYTEISKLVPKGRSRSFPKELHDYLLNELDINNIQYKLVNFDNSEWVVWEAKYTNTVETIINSYAIKVLNEK